MRKIIAIGGEPATGKSTIMKKFISLFDDLQPMEPVKLVPLTYSEKNDLFILGKYEEGEKFGGTDRYSMAVQPQATKFVNGYDGNIIFEGDRLFNQSFLELLADLPDTDLQIIYVTANRDAINQRHVDREDNQSETFTKGRRTKYENLRSNFVLMPYNKVFENNTQEDLERIVSYLKEQLYKETV
jgi:pantothenate kinase